MRGEGMMGWQLMEWDANESVDGFKLHTFWIDVVPNGIVEAKVRLLDLLHHLVLDRVAVHVERVVAGHAGVINRGGSPREHVESVRGTHEQQLH
jgi:hypothetical protein